MARRACAIVLGVVLIGCSNAGEESTSTVEIFSWWVAPGEAEALEAVLDLHRESNPEVEVVNAAATNAETARGRLRTRLASGLPPDTFQANAGADLRSWVLYNGVDASGSVVAPLDQIAAERGWTDTIPAPVLAAASHDGQLYGLPVNIHRLNSLFHNQAVLDAHGLSVPTTIAELEATCQTLEDAGVTCLALSARDGWTLSLLVFENVLVALAGPTGYEELLSGRGDPAAPVLREAAEITLRLLGYASADASSLTWDAATAMVASGDAAFTVMGDWAKGLLIAAGLTPGEDFGQAPFPGTAGTFVFTADTFTLPRGAPNREGALELMDTFASIEGQIAFNVIKGSIPARVDAPAETFDSLGMRQIEDFGSSTLVVASSGHVPPTFAEAVNESLVDMVDRGSVEVFLNTFENRYSELGADL